MDESASILIAVVIGVLLIATLMFFYVPEPSNSALVADTRLDVAVLEFRNSSTWAGIEETVRSRIEAKLVNTSAIEVFSRAQLDALLIERAIDPTGPIDATSADEIGALAGVNRLITGLVYAVDTRTDETTVCIEWTGSDCVTRVPGYEHSARVFAQAEVINVETGLIERAFDLDGSGSVALPAESRFGGFDTLLAKAVDEIANEISTTLTSAYFRKLRYGLYAEAEEKHGGYVGRGETDRFDSNDTVHLIVHFTQMENREPFDVEWTSSGGEAIHRVEDLVGQGDWRLYALDLTDLAPGRYAVRATLGGTLAFQAPFTMAP